MLFEINAVKFGAFRLKLHETQPDAPLSPIYCNFRRPPKGPLTDELVQELSALLYEIACRDNLQYDTVVGVPEAGNPFATAFARTAKVPPPWLEKEADAEKRQIVAPASFILRMTEAGFRAGERAVIIDDVVTEAHSKIETAIVLRSCSLIVENVLVILDREQGGKEALADAGITLHAAWPLPELLEFYLANDLITQNKYREVILYLSR